MSKRHAGPSVCAPVSGDGVLSPHQQLDGGGGGLDCPVRDGGHVKVVGSQRAAVVQRPPVLTSISPGSVLAARVAVPTRSITSHPTPRASVCPEVRVTTE